MMTDQERIAKLRDGTWDQTVVRGPNPTGFCVDETPFAQATADRIEELQAKLTKAVAGLRKIADHKHFVEHQGWTQNAEARIARKVLAELEKKE